MKARPEGVRIKHRLKQNSIKMYDKQGSILRIETTINDPADFKQYRTPESLPRRRPGANRTPPWGGTACARGSLIRTGERRSRRPPTSATWKPWLRWKTLHRWVNWPVGYVDRSRATGAGHGL